MTRPLVALALVAALSACVTTAPTGDGQPAPQPATQDIVGSSASSARTALVFRGFQPLRSYGNQTFWWHNRSQSCLRTVTDEAGTITASGPIASVSCSV